MSSKKRDLIDRLQTSASWTSLEEMSSVETGQMSAVEIGQMSAAETGQMSAVETRQMSTIETGDIWLLWGHIGEVENYFDPFFTPKTSKMEHSWWSRWSH